MHKTSLFSAALPDLKKLNPNLAALPWGATEAHNYHLPYCSDVIEAAAAAEKSAELAEADGARVFVLPPIPFGSNAQHLDQISAVHINTSTVIAILRDVCFSLKAQGIDKLLIVNSHGGNNFKPVVRDLQLEFQMLIVVADLYLMAPDTVKTLFDNPGDHAGQLETSLMMYLYDSKIDIRKAGKGGRIPFDIKSLNLPGIWTPRPWSASHPDTGSGDPAGATKEKGEKYFNALCSELSRVIIDLSKAEKGEIPYI